MEREFRVGYIKKTRAIWFISLFAAMFIGGVAYAAPQYPLTCSSCHGMPPADSPERDPDAGSFVGNHETHQPAVATASDCSKCHNVNWAADNYSHTDGKISFKDSINGSPKQFARYSSYSLTVFKNQTSVPVQGTCSNVNCHFESRTPVWGANLSGACDTCHNSNPTTYSHTAHYGTAPNPDLLCVDCHADHQNELKPFQHATSAGHRSIDVKASYGYSGSNGQYLPSQSATRVLGSCATATCHANPYGSGTVPSPVWGSSVGCVACHTGGGAFGGNGAPATGSHAKHMALVGSACNQCHDGAVSGTSGGTYHADGKIDVTNGYPATAKHLAGSYTGTCSTASCHASPYSTGTVVSPVWGTASGCASCHKDTGAFTANGAPNTGSHAAHMALVGSACNQCHDGAVSAVSGGISHANGVVDVSNTYTASPVTKHTPGTYTGYCMSASCHASPYGTGAVNSPTWGATTGCASCHTGTGAFTAAGAPDTGSHAKHMALPNSNCGQCHTGAVSGVSGGNTHANGTVEVVSGYTASPVTKHPIGTYAGTCANSCHTDGNGTSVPSSNWGVAMPANCTGCHGGAANVTPASKILATGKHRSHMNNYSTLGKGNNLKCAECHAKTTALASDTALAGSGHVNGFKDYSGVKARGSANYQTATGVCTNLYCHSNGQSVPRFKNMTGSKAWRGTATFNCSGCHGSEPGATWSSSFGAPNYPNKYDGTLKTANSHERHTVVAGTTDSRGCAKCHDTSVDASVAGKLRNYSTTHLNKVIDVSFGIYGSYSTASRSCSTYCHSNVQAPGGNGPATVYAKPVWGANGTMTCASCHVNMATLTETPETLQLGSHKRHTVDTVYSCSVCHGSSYSASSANTVTHADGTINVEFTGNRATGTTYSQAAANPPGNGYGTCSTSKCHGRATRNWGINTTLDVCEKCHGSARTAQYKSSFGNFSGYFKDTAGSISSPYVGTHVSHLNATHNLTAVVQCTECHTVPSSVSSFGHMTSLPARIVWGPLSVRNAIIRGYTAATQPMSPSYNPVTRTCNNTYCHAGVQIKDATTGIVSYQGQKPNPSWADAGYLAGTGCNMCHGYPPKGVHTTSTNCNACHNSVDQSNVAIADKTKHLNGVIDVTVDNCLDCHSSYNTCAPNDPKCVNKKLVGGHSVHTNSELFLAGKSLSKGDYIDSTWIYGITYKNGFPQYACGFCHPMDIATHKNGVVDVDMDPTHALRGSVKTKNKAGGPWLVTYVAGSSVVCNNVYCHSNGFVSETTQQYAFKQTPDWYYADNNGGVSPWANVDRCAQCHGNSPNTAGVEGSSAHARHVVGNHYKDVFDGYSGKLKPAGAPGTGSVHGDPATSTNFNCNICHFDTVRVAYNDKGSVCNSCHAVTAPVKGTMVIYSSSTKHVNGDVDVVFMEPFAVKSKAQLRDSIGSVQSVYTSWTRVNGYKNANSYDQARTKPNYVGGTCTTTACHNGTQMEWRTKGPLPCAACHTGLPQ